MQVGRYREPRRRVATTATASTPFPCILLHSGLHHLQTLHPYLFNRTMYYSLI